MSILLLGPYIGNFLYEITVFRPHIQYIFEVSECDDVYVSSHLSRSFLYDWVQPSNFIPIYEYLSRDEDKHHGYTHTDISKSEFGQIVKRTSRSISSDKIDIYTLPYSKSTNTIPFQQKIYSKITYPDIEIDDKDFIIIIPDKSIDTFNLYNKLKDDYNIIVIGDMNCGIENDNVILKDPDYFTNGYIKIFNYIHKAKLVITPLDHWALICNIQGIPLLYWGDNASMYKKDGVYGFGNNVVSICDDTIKPSQVKYMI